MVTIGIVAHVARSKQASDLREQVQASYVAYDFGALGCTANHLRVWEHLAQADTPWVLVLEDDALPVNEFRPQLDMALAVAPSPVVSLYLGTGNPTHWQRPIERALNRADKAQAQWLTGKHLLHAVAIAMHTSLVPSMLDSVRHDRVPIDEAISRWIGKQQLSVSYTVPSLCDHADTPSVIGRHPDGRGRTQPRRAWRTGTRSEWRSNTTTLAF